MCLHLCCGSASRDADPDPSFHFDVDPDPTFHFDLDPDPTFKVCANPDPAPHESDASLRPLAFTDSILSLLIS
jgi:hypothetical protein